MIEEQINLLKKNGSVFSKQDIYILKRLCTKTNKEKIKDLKKIVENFINKRNFGVKRIDIGISIKKFKTIIQVPKTNLTRIYDIASITKLFTLKLTYDLYSEGIINLNEKITDSLPQINLQNCTIEDILKMNNSIETKGKLSETKTKEEFENRLLTANYIVTNKSKYTDIGFIILGKIIEYKINKLNNLKMEYKEIVNTYVSDQLNLKSTMFVPTKNNNFEIIGNGNHLNLPHDPKTRIYGGFTGAAGLFSSAEDFISLSKLIFTYKFFDKNFVKKIFDYTFLDEKERKRSYSGIYLKTRNNDHSYIPNSFTKYSIAHQGYTGSIIVFDFYTKIHFSILVDAIDKLTDEKTDNFFKYIHKLKKIVGLYCLSIYMSNK